eukprot:7652663-Lingulodinium_polyedra.AAC.2
MVPNGLEHLGELREAEDLPTCSFMCLTHVRSRTTWADTADQTVASLASTSRCLANSGHTHCTTLPLRRTRIFICGFKKTIGTEEHLQMLTSCVQSIESFRQACSGPTPDDK